MTNPRSIRLGLGQLLVEGGEPERNLARATDMIARAKAEGCGVVLLPECLDLAWTHPSAKSEAQPVPGRFSDVLCAAAAARGVYLCAGLTEREGDRVYNSAILVDPSGKILLKYRKINELEVGHEFYELGTWLGTVETPFGRVGVNICADNYIDSLAIGHALARMGAEIILSPSSWTVDYSVTEIDNPYGEKWEKPYSILARSYGLVVAGTTSVGIIVGGPYEGKKMVGCSLVVGPTGVIARGRYNEFAGELIVTEINVPVRSERGTQIGNRLRKAGARMDGEL